MRALRLAVAALAAACLAAPASAAAAQVPAQSAASFRDSIGVQTHIVYYDTAYGDWSRIVQKLDELGVDHLRDGMYANPQWPDWNERFYQAVELAAAHGHRFLVNMGEPNFGQGTLDQLMGMVRGRLHGAVDGLEAPNEYDLFHGGADWASLLRAYQQQLYATAKADPLVRDLPVIGPSLVFDDSDEKLGSLEGSLDYGNLHPYTGGEAPSQAHIQMVENMFKLVAGSKPLYATEAGFHNAMNATSGQPPVPEDVAASYILRTYLEHFRAGIRRTYAYELIDEKPNPGLTDPEQHFGLLRNDFSEKPAFTALERMLATIGRPAPVATTTPLDVALSGDTTGVQQLLLQKSAGHYQLFLWQAASQWDTRTRQRIAVAPRAVQLTLPADATVQVSRPTTGDSSTSAAPERQVAVSVPADPVVLDLDFGAQPPVVKPPVVKPPVVKPPVVKPPVAKPPVTSRCPRPRLRGGTVVRGGGLETRVWGAARPVRVGFCAATNGTASVELRVVRAGAPPRILVSRTVPVLRARRALVPLALPAQGPRLQALSTGTLLVRVVYRPAGSERAVVVRQRVGAVAAPLGSAR